MEKIAHKELNTHSFGNRLGKLSLLSKAETITHLTDFKQNSKHVSSAEIIITKESSRMIEKIDKWKWINDFFWKD